MCLSLIICVHTDPGSSKPSTKLLSDHITDKQSHLARKLLQLNSTLVMLSLTSLYCAKYIIFTFTLAL